MNDTTIKQDPEIDCRIDTDSADEHTPLIPTKIVPQKLRQSQQHFQGAIPQQVELPRLTQLDEPIAASDRLKYVEEKLSAIHHGLEYLFIALNSPQARVETTQKESDGQVNKGISTGKDLNSRTLWGIKEYDDKDVNSCVAHNFIFKADVQFDANKLGDLKQDVVQNSGILPKFEARYGIAAYVILTSDVPREILDVINRRADAKTLFIGKYQPEQWRQRLVSMADGIIKEWLEGDETGSLFRGEDPIRGG
ncbi:hypothetical protein BGW36DRAFT_432867 [Talaromyces proteolyticus]|uniref:Uncharacterized protein n=1 Tax=Talaromyces proteolyticus TaxID=1131652 RepID=A0AAD4KJR7_9EURO|nr:uncharacterized protein BGW36DRAFT_432867 [Talaromyces proteolyticus]KAH8689899.1 hypothetical protein BGW36DRAFT_432867 [Talaromyces proteolyticus]